MYSNIEQKTYITLSETYAKLYPCKKVTNETWISRVKIVEKN